MTAPKPKKRTLPLTIRNTRAKGHPVTGVRAEGLAVIERLAANGNSRATIATALGTSDSVLSRLIKENPEVAAAFDAGKGKLHDELVGILLTHAREGNVNRPGFTGGQNSRRIARYGTESKEDLKAVFT